MFNNSKLALTVKCLFIVNKIAFTMMHQGNTDTPQSVTQEGHYYILDTFGTFNCLSLLIK